LFIGNFCYIGIESHSLKKGDFFCVSWLRVEQDS
jgi:hypothetical protein